MSNPAELEHLLLEQPSNLQLQREQQLIFERARTGILFVRQRVIVRCNPRFAEIFGWDAGTLPGRSTRLLFPSVEAWQETGERVYATLLADGSFSGELPYCRRDGQAIWCSVIGSLLDSANPDEGSVWFYDDVTEKRRTLAAMQDLLREYALIFDNAMIGISYLRDRVFLRCNRRLEEIFGFAPGTLAGQSARVLFESDEEYEAVGHRVYTEATARDGFSGEIRYRRQDGAPIWVRASARPIDDGERQTWIWTHQDVTRRHLAEEALRISHGELERRVAERTGELSQQLHFLQQLIETIPGPLHYKDRNGRYLGCNQAFADLIGMSRDEVIGKTVYDIAARELADHYKAADDALFAQPGTQVYETKIRNARGELREAMFHKATWQRPDGAVGGLVGVMLDITERKRMEERLLQAATVFDSTAEGVIIAAPDGAILAVNRAFTEITGYAEAEVIGRNARLLQSGRHDRSFYRMLWQAVLREGRWRGEVWNRRKDGGVFPEWLTISAVKNKAGAITHFVGVFSDITAIKEAQDRLDYQAHHDPLTDLPNRLLFEDRLDKALQRARRERARLALLFLDLDRFKNINDTLGHHVGDCVLREVSHRFLAAVREADTVARLGGDEFIIILENLPEAAAASRVADKILDDLRRNIVSAEQEFFVGASIGISLYPDDGADAATLLKNADIAMYRAKERGRNTYEFFTARLTEFSLDRFRLEVGIRHALERNEFCAYFQPQYSLADGRLVGAETLIRWRHPERGMVPPGEFIPLAEESGLIVPVGEWILRDACRTWAAWHARGLAPGVLAINVSGVEFRRGKVLESVQATLAETGLPPDRLELEITESAIMNQADSSIEILHRLRALGVQLAIDDFGTGYSSLAYLKRLPLNKLKVDQSFVHGLPGDSEDAAIARAVIALGHSLQLKVIAEGVETDPQREFLRREGCDEMQGYLSGRPVPAEEFERAYLAPSPAPPP